jgi:hypothetical protein
MGEPAYSYATHLNIKFEPDEDDNAIRNRTR